MPNNCYFSADEFCGYFWSTNIMYLSHVLLVLYEAHLDNDYYFIIIRFLFCLHLCTLLASHCTEHNFNNKLYAN